MWKVIVIFLHGCPTCNMMLPLIEDVVAEYGLQTEWVDADKMPEAFERYEVEVVPTMIFYKEEKEVARMTGMIGETILRERIEKNTCISRESII